MYEQHAQSYLCLYSLCLHATTMKTSWYCCTTTLTTCLLSVKQPIGRGGGGGGEGRRGAGAPGGGGGARSSGDTTYRPGNWQVPVDGPVDVPGLTMGACTRLCLAITPVTIIGLLFEMLVIFRPPQPTHPELHSVQRFGTHSAVMKCI